MPATFAFESGTDTTRLVPSNDDDADVDVEVDDNAYDVLPDGARLLQVIVTN